MAHVLTTPSASSFSQKKSLTYKNVLISANNCLKRHFFCKFQSLKVALKQTEPQEIWYNWCFSIAMGSFQREKIVKLIISAPPYKLNNIKTRISCFAKNWILAALEHLLKWNSVGSVPNLETVMCLDRNEA